ncbi:coatomer epsilon subunit protein [Cryptosporidium felis]|nr:coatomer epsilon subunit protein [Cryptosporidium felis]
MGRFSEEIIEIESNVNSGYYEKALMMIQGAENIKNKDFDTDTLLEINQFRCKLHLNQLKKDSLGSLYSEAVANQKLGLAALCLYAIFCLSETTEERKYELLNEAKQLYIQNNDRTNTIEVILTLMNLHVKDFKSALAILDSAPPSTKIIQVFAFCTLNRFDLAQNLFEDLTENYNAHISELESFQSFSEFKESALVRIASAWLQCLKGEYNASFITYANIQTDFGENSSIRLPPKSRDCQSAIILNGISAIHMQRRHWNDAYETLLNAYKIDPKFEVTLSNLITCCHFLNLIEESSRYIEELHSVNSNHFKISCIEAIDRAFKIYS